MCGRADLLGGKRGDVPCSLETCALPCGPIEDASRKRDGALFTDSGSREERSGTFGGL